MVVLGNSIALHSHSPAIGWNGDWGMAASAQDRDWIHVVAKDRGYIATVVPMDIGWTWLIDNAKSTVREDAPRLVVVQVGDNYPVDGDRAAMRKLYAEILSIATGSGAQVIAVGKWGSDDWINQAMREIADASGVPFAEIHDLNTYPNRALDDGMCSDAAVCWHPGDRGMASIAERVSAIIPWWYYFPIVWGGIAGTLPGTLPGTIH